jgi:hypothetical protein
MLAIDIDGLNPGVRHLSLLGAKSSQWYENRAGKLV